MSKYQQINQDKCKKTHHSQYLTRLNIPLEFEIKYTMEDTNHLPDQSTCVSFRKHLNHTTKIVMKPLLKSIFSDSDKLLEPPTLSHLSCSSYKTHQDNLSFITSIKQSIIPDAVKMDGMKMDGIKIDPNHFNPILSQTSKPINDIAMRTSKKHRFNFMNMSGY